MTPLLRRLTARLLRTVGYSRVHTDQAGLTAELAQAHAVAWAAQPADLAKALPRLGTALAFQPGLIDLHHEQADTAAYLNNLAGCAETNLDLADPDQHVLYLHLLTAARAAEELQRAIASAAARTLPTAAAELQHT
ncbi:hypothetical protein ACWCYY_34960 [Kitasatospora sp. NPDC001664]